MNFFTERLRLEAPIFQAPMAGAQGHALAAEVCEAGGLGAIPAAALSLEALDAELNALRAETKRPFNVNFFAHHPPSPDAEELRAWHAALAPYYKEFSLDPGTIPKGPGRMPFNADAVAVLKKYRPAAVSFHFGLPESALLDQVKSLGCLVLSSATTADEALWLERHGADAIIAQGAEAGGHRGMFLTEDLHSQIGLMALLPQITAAVKLPIVAAGGIADVSGIRAARALGASAVQIGTSYLACPESTISALYRATLASPNARFTALTNLFSGRPARGIMNRLMRELGPMCASAPRFPLATNAIAPLRVAAEAKGDTGFSPLWAGQNAALAKMRPARELTRYFIDSWHSS
ncbi:MAG: nitronate monooxygenase [Burkholderiaceae bacterium]|nr:nitronate monooxygenase [Burkholderiaceae bacterium]